MQEERTKPEDGEPLDLAGAMVDGRYQLDELVGSGAMGAVYRATQLAIGRTVAVKVLSPKVQLDERLEARFKREAQAIGRMNHPGCLVVHDFGLSKELGATYMVVEYLDGQTLDEFMRGHTLPHLTFELIARIADALGHAHGEGIVHRDLRPSNVMVLEGPGGMPRVKVLDFGLSLLFEPTKKHEDSERITLTGEIHGSPQYMAPEQCRGALEVSPAADMYALGVIAYEMLFGHLPFEHEDVPSLLMAHISDPPPHPSHPDVPEFVTQLVLDLLEKEPERRPDAHAVMATLAPFIRHDATMQFKLGEGSFEDLDLLPKAAAGLGEDTLDSEAYETATGLPAVGAQPAGASGNFKAFATSRDARIGVIIGAVLAFCLVGLAIMAGILALQ